MFLVNKKGSLEDNENINEDDLVLKIYSNEGQSEPMLIPKNSTKIYKNTINKKMSANIQNKNFLLFHFYAYI